MGSESEIEISSAVQYCGICTDEIAGDEELFTNAGCKYVYRGHHTFCLGCVGRHVEAKVREDPARVTCPDPRCRAALEPQSCRALAHKLPDDVIVRWEMGLVAHLVRFLQLNSCPFRDCRAPYPSTHTEGEIGKATLAQCWQCRRLICERCQAPWHMRATCKMHRKKVKKEIAEMNKLIKSISGGRHENVKFLDRKFKGLAKSKYWRRCPGCRHYVQKEQGCEHILCRCRYEFCYECGKEWSWAHKCPLSYWRGRIRRFRFMIKDIFSN